MVMILGKLNREVQCGGLRRGGDASRTQELEELAFVYFVGIIVGEGECENITIKGMAIPGVAPR